MKCKNDIFMSKIGGIKLNKQMEVHFDVQNNLPDCKRIVASKYVSSGEGAKYNRYKIPANQFECFHAGCVNSGTLFNGGAATLYKVSSDATEFSAGVITFYVIPPASTGKAVVTISDVSALTNAYVYEVDLDSITADSDGFVPVVVDLSATPTSTVGAGWTPSESGAYISIAITATGGTAMTGVGISSIAIFDEMADFETSSHVIMACLTGIDGSWDFSAAEATCFSPGGYDTSNVTGFDKTITGKALTPNFMLLNPLAKKGTATTGWDNVTIEEKVKELSETDYGYITISDMNQDECGFFSVALADSCVATDGQLVRLSIPTKIDLDETHYQLIDNGDGTTTVLFNKIHIGASVLVSYPKSVNVEEWVFSEDAVGDVRVRVSYVKEYTDGTKYRFVFNNVIVTSFPDALTEDETEFSFTVNIQKDAQGYFGRAYRILD